MLDLLRIVIGLLVCYLLVWVGCISVCLWFTDYFIALIGWLCN